MEINVVLVIETFAAFLIAMTLHDWGHSVAAMLLGDETMVDDGMLSANPLTHVAPIGAFVAVVLSFSAYAGIGWGRPTRTDAARLRGGPDFGAMLVAIAGPFVNLGIGLVILIGVTFIPGFARLPAFVDSAN